MSLPWFRMDSNVASHDKILALLTDPSPKRWQAFTSWVCAMGWSHGCGTDGYIPTAALHWVHGTKATAELLVKHRLWEYAAGGYQIRNFANRQPLASITESTRQAQADGGTYGNHVRWHVNKGTTAADCEHCRPDQKGQTA